MSLQTSLSRELRSSIDIMCASMIPTRTGQRSLAQGEYHNRQPIGQEANIREGQSTDGFEIMLFDG